MAPPHGIRYTPDQLQFLKNSPLVRKPDRLPSIKEWMPQDQEQNARKTRPVSTSENDSQRPSLLGNRHFSRTSTGAEDLVLGPPKFAFSSATATKTLKSTDTDRQGGQEDDSERLASRNSFFRDRDGDRSRDKPGFANGRRGQRDEGASWSENRARRNQEGDDEDRFGRNHGRDRDGDESQPRRTGAGRGRFEQPWGRDENVANKESDNNRITSIRSGGWREREREKERRDDRDWQRGVRLNDEPEWMGQDAAPAEKKPPKTMEDFAKWMEEMKNKKAGRDGREAAPDTSRVEPEAPIEAPTSANLPAQYATTSVPPTPFTFDGPIDKMFGLWGDKTGPETPDLDGGVSIKPATKAAPGKAKASRFKSLFAPQEEPPRAEVPVVDPPHIEPPTVQAPRKEENEDKIGFQNILQMLGATGLSNAPQPERHASSSANTNKVPNMLDLLQASPRTGRPEQPSAFTPLPSQASEMEAKGRYPPSSFFGRPPPERDLQHHERVPERYGVQGTFKEASKRPPSHSSPGIDSPNLQALLGARQPTQADDEKRQFLLNLIKQQPTPSQTPIQDISRLPQEPPNGSIFVGERGSNLQMPKARGPPAGLFDLNEQDLHRRSLELNAQTPDQLRKPAPRQPPGLYDDAALGAHAPRRTINEQQNRAPMSNMGIPQQPDPYMMKFQGLPPQQERVAPPPGFPPQNRMPPPQGPPGFPQHPGFPNMDLQRGPPGLLSRNNNMIPGSGHAYGQMPPPPPPPGYFQGPGGPPGHMNAPPPNFPGLSGHHDLMMGPPPPRRAPGQNGFDMYGDMGVQRSRNAGPPGPYM